MIKSKITLNLFVYYITNTFASQTTMEWCDWRVCVDVSCIVVAFLRITYCIAANNDLCFVFLPRAQNRSVIVCLCIRRVALDLSASGIAVHPYGSYAGINDLLLISDQSNQFFLIFMKKEITFSGLIEYFQHFPALSEKEFSGSCAAFFRHPHSHHINNNNNKICSRNYKIILTVEMVSLPCSRHFSS